jgi:hypothetical protein
MWVNISRFRWAYCQLKELRKCRTAHQVRATLRSLRKTLDYAYNCILAGISDSDRGYAFRALQWLTFAARPVSVAEVADAMTVGLDTELPQIDPDRALRDPCDLLDICPSLVSVWTGTDKAKAGGCGGDGEDDSYESRDSDALLEVIQLTHYSVTEYLVSDRAAACSATWCRPHASSSHQMLAESCLAYLLSFERLMPYEELAAHFLGQYAARYWTSHSRRADEGHGAAIKLLAAEAPHDVDALRPELAHARVSRR